MRLPRRDWGLMVLGAALLMLAYPPFALVVPPFVCLVPAALLLLRGADDALPWRRHLHQGFWYGVITQTALLYWLAGALWRYDATAILLYALAVAVFGAVTAVLFAGVGRAVRPSPARLLAALPAGVIGLEWIAQQAGPIAFPWHRMALTVTPYPLLVQSADVLGSGGLGFLVVTVNACLALAWWSRRTPRTALLRLETAAAVLTFMCLYGAHRLSTIHVESAGSAAVVQPNVGWDEKWRPGEADGIVARTLDLTESAIAETGAELVALPETAFPGALREHPRWSMGAERLSRSTWTTLLVGGVDGGGGADPGRASTNALFSFTPGPGSGRELVQRKHRLVPVVELGLRAMLTVGPGTPPEVRRGPLGRYAALICFDLTFESRARELTRSGAQLLVTVSNDAWLGRSVGPEQHFAHAVLRAVENRVPVIRSANTGVSGIVDPLGRVVTRAAPLEETYVAGPVLRAGIVPPAVRLGGVAGPAGLALLVMLVLGAGRCRPPGPSHGAEPNPRSRRRRMAHVGRSIPRIR